MPHSCIYLQIDATYRWNPDTPVFTTTTAANRDPKKEEGDSSKGRASSHSMVLGLLYKSSQQLALSL